MSIYGYARISTAKQNIDRQIRNIESAFPGAYIFAEAYTGTKVDGRKEWGKLMGLAVAGDTIVFDSVSRLSRNADQGAEIYKELYERGIDLIFLKERFCDSSVYREAVKRQLDSISTGDQDTDNLINGIFKAVNDFTIALAKRQIVLAFEQAQKEVDDLRQRTKEGILTAKLSGKQIGHTPGAEITTRKEKEARTIIEKHAKCFGGTLSDDEVMRLCGISRNSYYKYKRAIKEGGAA